MFDRIMVPKIQNANWPDIKGLFEPNLQELWANFLVRKRKYPYTIKYTYESKK
jgi:hypothetical protein